MLSIRPFRRLWIATSLSSLGDWLSLLALTTLAASLTGSQGPAAQGAAVGGVWLTSLLPALLLGPLAGAVADQLDRRINMIIGDVVRAALYLSIPLNLTLGLVNNLTWMYLVAVPGLLRVAVLDPGQGRLDPQPGRRPTSWNRPTSSACSPRSAPRRSPRPCSSCSPGSAGPSAPPRTTSPTPLTARSTWPCTSTRPRSWCPRSPSTRSGRLPTGPAASGSPRRRWRRPSGRAGGSSADPGGARPGHRDGRRVRGGRRGGRPGPVLHPEHAARRHGRLGRGVRDDLRRAGRRACSSACGSCAGSAAAGCSACPSPRPRVPLVLIGLIPNLARGHRAGCPAGRAARASPTSPATRSSASRWTTTPAAGRSRSSSPPSG